jgi:hypothetical protein
LGAALIFQNVVMRLFHLGPRQLSLIAHGKAALDELVTRGSGFGSLRAWRTRNFCNLKKMSVFSDAIGLINYFPP